MPGGEEGSLEALKCAACECHRNFHRKDLNAFPSEAAGMVGATTTPQPPYGHSSSKKRFRTKFTQDQKERMMEFAEKVGWRINKQDVEAVERFCSEVGVRRQVFKVWMHNNKTVRKQQQQQQQPSPTTTTTNHMMNLNMHHLHHHHPGQHDEEQVQQQHQEGML
ncbi:unnamed protein product [Linum tenue]|uniref:ZF-HD dimerization-type domain-containing protein n=1 Tax=Linum tenue TaxID=586396 RepID=A0AAV0LPL9_9ROSI|nr:unnamed protein product [Linum tenue]